MNIKTISAVLITVFAFLLIGCKQTPYDKACSYIDELSSEVMAATNDTEYDAVYNKIVSLNTSEEMSDLRGLSQEQSQTIKAKATELTLEALAVKAILYVMPKDVTPTVDDISKLANECIEKKLDTMTSPYSDVRKLVYEYYHIAE